MYKVVLGVRDVGAIEDERIKLLRDWYVIKLLFAAEETTGNHAIGLA